jgi:hypothetical protein
MASRQNHTISRPPFVVDVSSLVRGPGRQINWDRVPESFRQGARATVVVGAAGAAQNATSIPVTVTFKNGGTVIPAGAVLDFGGGKYARVSAPYTSGANISVDAIPTAVVQDDTANYFEPGDSGRKALPAGTVISLDGPTRTVVAVAFPGNTGNGTIGTVSASMLAEAGIYRLTCVEPATNAGQFVVEAPDGTTVGDATVAVAATVGGVTFLIADGSIDFAVGDQFTIEVNTAAASQSGMAIPRSMNRGDAIGILEAGAVQGDPSASLSGYGVLVGGVLNENMLPDAVSGELNEDWKDELDRIGTGFSWQYYTDSRTSGALA